MSVTLSTAATSSTKRPATPLRILNACWESIARYCVHRGAIEHLRELEDNSLRDIGLARSQIEAAVHGFMSDPDRTRI